MDTVFKSILRFLSFLPGFVLWLAKQLSGPTSSDFSKTRLQSGIRTLLASDASGIYRWSAYVECFIKMQQYHLWVTWLACSPQPATITRITKQDAYPGAHRSSVLGEIKDKIEKHSQFGSSSRQFLNHPKWFVPTGSNGVNGVVIVVYWFIMCYNASLWWSI